MPFFQGAQDVRITGGSFHEITTIHAQYATNNINPTNYHNNAPGLNNTIYNGPVPEAVRSPPDCQDFQASVFRQQPATTNAPFPPQSQELGSRAALYIANGSSTTQNFHSGGRVFSNPYQTEPASGTNGFGVPSSYAVPPLASESQDYEEYLAWKKRGSPSSPPGFNPPRALGYHMRSNFSTQNGGRPTRGATVPSTVLPPTPPAPALDVISNKRGVSPNSGNKPPALNRSSQPQRSYSGPEHQPPSFNPSTPMTKQPRLPDTYVPKSGHTTLASIIDQVFALESSTSTIGSTGRDNTQSGAESEPADNHDMECI